MKTQKQNSKSAISDKAARLAKLTGYDAEYVQRALNVQANKRDGDRRDVAEITGFSLKHISNVVHLKVRNESIIALMEKLIANRTEALKDAVLYQK